MVKLYMKKLRFEPYGKFINFTALEVVVYSGDSREIYGKFYVPVMPNRIDFLSVINILSTNGYINILKDLLRGEIVYEDSR